MGDSIMRTLNVVFEDMEHAALEELKNKSGKNWHDFLIGLMKGDSDGK